VQQHILIQVYRTPSNRTEIDNINKAPEIFTCGEAIRMLITKLSFVNLFQVQ